MRVLLLSRYTRLGASSRLRTMQYLPHLEHVGFDVEQAPFFDDAYLTALYSGRRGRTRVLRYFARRIAALRRRPTPDLIWLEYEALPWVPWLIEGALLPLGVPVVVDYDDAVFHRYQLHRFAPVRWLLGRKIDRVMASAAMVTVGNAYLAQHARDAGAAHVEIVPTVVNLRAYDAVSHPPAGQRPRVGWIGTPQTWDALARPSHAVLLPVLERHDAVFRAVGAALDPREGDRLEIVPWSEATEVAQIRTMDIGIMPLPDTPWTRGKCGYKLIQYMACGLPVVASPVGVNAEIVEHGVNGFLAQTDDEWRTAVSTLISDPDLRQRMGAAGRRKVEARYSLEAWAPRLVELLREVVAG